MRWPRRLGIGLIGLLSAEVLIALVPLGFSLYSTGPGAVMDMMLFYVAMTMGVPSLASWVLLCLPFLILRRQTPRPADAAKLAALGFGMGFAGFLVIAALYITVMVLLGRHGNLQTFHLVLPAIYSGFVCALAMYFYVKLSVRRMIKELRTAAASR